jgi:uncharacterized protein DUF4838
MPGRATRQHLIVLCAVGGLAATSWQGDRALTIVRDHKSLYSIYFDSHAPQTVETAAGELREYIRRATGAELRFVKADHAPDGPFIALGRTGESIAAGVTSERLPADGFVIAARGSNLFIAGPDSADGERLPGGGTTSGTLNGVYGFLERSLDVRWLMPGAGGTDVPARTDLAIPAVDATDGPGFQYRRLAYIQVEPDGRGDVSVWSRRLRLGYSLALSHSHNWDVIGPELFESHPDWFASRDGRPARPDSRYKLETTNPELVAAFAQKAIDAFRRDPNLRSFSLSPSDSEGWSDSAASRALYDRDSQGALSVTRLVLRFYNDVARIVGREFPDRLLCGYVYAQYLYPPASGIPPIEPNVCLVVAPNIGYGYQLFRPAVKRDFAAVMKAWGGAARTTAYYDLPSQLEQTYSAPTPASASLLGFAFSTAAAAGMKGVYVHGVPDWGYGAATNYLEARLAWNPNADASALLAEFHRRAYGDASGALIQAAYARLEQSLERHYLSHPKADYTLTPDLLRDVYAPAYPELERSYGEALRQCPGPAACGRLKMLGKNLIVLRWNLRLDNLIPDTPSPLAQSDAELRRLLREWASDLATSPETRAATLAKLEGR